MTYYTTFYAEIRNDSRNKNWKQFCFLFFSEWNGRLEFFLKKQWPKGFSKWTFRFKPLPVAWVLQCSYTVTRERFHLSSADCRGIVSDSAAQRLCFGKMCYQSSLFLHCCIAGSIACILCRQSQNALRWCFGVIV